MKIIGHEDTKKIIRLFLDKNYSSYSFLFEGKDCIGKKLVALLTAKAFLCEKNYGFGCGECDSCRLSDNTISNIYQKTELNPHPDILVISPDREIKIDQIRKITDFLKLKGKKVAIIEKAEKMNVEASNALLKTLEEPPENSMIILTTSNLNALLPTIISRCKKIRFKPLKKEEIQQILSLKGVEEKNIKTAIALSDGSMCIPEIILNRPNLFKYAKDLFTVLSIDELHPEGIISLGEILDRLEVEEVKEVLDIVEKILYKKMLKGEINPDFYDRFIRENQELKNAISKGVKKKLAIEGMYFNLKT
ncbi:DNA polymerase-3 subunit delta' [Persephonella hydrogeniphila]|uniref:DNA polymerase-3 subunit delta n=1 Tax=Persephonella hydrogeniphila TaxID=198703 RepID=A0A285NF99_9AQUI|nr:DNA polymerase III subunit [Persephonella hydrogeniphila]SNZ06576.1 DNA polymerase-3 subunit delta' [Persephonella hydrogeniphila]